ncbi:hypothetical protein F0562_028006 [Nyssa sinensis]|uniref:Uncharacterized protein n=1 Tax=Nyssa sinensis TaxID=561372 RepID=A0A5J5B718_9ASTE|nr:hypothetical protein F0562_028006 [Nyssa sinensis]
MKEEHLCHEENASMNTAGYMFGDFNTRLDSMNNGLSTDALHLKITLKAAAVDCCNHLHGFTKLSLPENNKVGTDNDGIR